MLQVREVATDVGGATDLRWQLHAIMALQEVGSLRSRKRSSMWYNRVRSVAKYEQATLSVLHIQECKLYTVIPPYPRGIGFVTSRRCGKS